MDYKIILASKSPRRKQLLRKFISIKVVESSFNETMKGKPASIVKKNAFGKAIAVAKRYPANVVVGADTIVSYKGKILGKPKNKKQAIEMLNLISGKWISVYGGIAVIKGNKAKIEVVVSRVKMKQMSKKEIKEYVDTKEPLDKAGAFGAQEKGALLIEKISGDYFNVVGISLFKLNQMLKSFGIDLLKQ